MSDRREYNRLYYLKKREERLAYQRAYYQAHREEVKRKVVEYQKKRAQRELQRIYDERERTSTPAIRGRDGKAGRRGTL